MRRYLLKRVLTGLLMVIISVGINFTLVRLAPGDPIVMLAGVDNPNPAQVEALTKKFGLDKSIPEQFWIFFKGLLRLDFGDSLKYKMPVGSLLLSRLACTAMLAAVTVLFTVVISFMTSR